MHSRSWPVLGRLASIVLKTRDKKPLLVREAELAERFSLSRGTLRNYRDAQRLVRSVPDLELRRALFGLSAAGAAQLVRWMQRDADAAIAFLREQPFAGPREIIAAEQRSLLSEPPLGWKRLDSLEKLAARLPTTPLRLPQEIADFVREHRLIRGSRNIALMTSRMTQPGKLASFYRIDFLIPLVRYLDVFETTMETHEPLADAAIIELPFFGSLDRYAVEAKSIWARSVAAASIYPLVCLIFPGPAGRRRFLAALPQELRKLDKGQGKLGLRDRRWSCLVPASGMGSIVITTRLDIFQASKEHR